MHSGIAMSDKKETEKQKVLHTLSGMIIWHLDSKAAQIGGEIDGKLAKEGRKIDPVDSMIAGIAITGDEKVLTRNVKHFSRIAGLKIETY